MAEKPNPPNPEETPEFHETEYYSNFQEQEGECPVPPEELKESEPATPDQSAPPSSEMDVNTIQYLMDEALRKGSGRAAEIPDGMDTSIHTDWAGWNETPAPSATPPEESGPVRGRSGVLPRPQIVVGRRKVGKRRRRSLFSRHRMRKYTSLVLSVVAIILAGGTFYYMNFYQTETLTNLWDKAQADHLQKRYLDAAQVYHRILDMVDESDQRTRTKVLFLLGGVYQQLYLENPDQQAHFQSAIENFNECISLDQTDLQIYAGEATMTKVGMLLAQTESDSSNQRELLDMAMVTLREMIESPRFQLNPAVLEGKPQRMLARLIEVEDPLAAIRLYEQARDIQHELEEGLENFAIARIHHQLLDNHAQAEDYYELVRQNELASPELRNQAIAAIAELRASQPATPDLYPGELMQEIPLMEVEYE